MLMSSSPDDVAAGLADNRIRKVLRALPTPGALKGRNIAHAALSSRIFISLVALVDCRQNLALSLTY